MSKHDDSGDVKDSSEFPANGIDRREFFLKLLKKTSYAVPIAISLGSRPAFSSTVQPQQNLGLGTSVGAATNASAHASIGVAASQQASVRVGISLSNSARTTIAGTASNQAGIRVAIGLAPTISGKR